MKRSPLRALVERIAVPRLTLQIVGGSGACFILGLAQPAFLESLPLVPQLVLQGEVWRLVTFLFYPLDLHPIFAFFVYYFFYVMGTALEEEWGDARYTRYVLLSVCATVAASFAFPSFAMTNEFIVSSIFLAFAYLYPDFVVYLFFVIPLKIKYLAYVSWAFLALTVAVAAPPLKAQALAGIMGFAVFFLPEIISRAPRRGADPRPVEPEPVRHEPFHVCTTCGRNDVNDTGVEYRICSTCKGEFCLDHLRTHPHPGADPVPTLPA